MHTVLIVDDENIAVQIIQVILRRAGYATLSAASGEDALALVYGQRPDAIILDDMMLGLSGGEVCMRLKGDPQTRDIPIIMYSAGAKVRNAAYIRQIGADGVLFKPALPTEIVEAVAALLEAPVS